MEEEFEQVKNHDVLWNRITKTLNNHKVPVTCNQVKNKWKNLKKTYKKVVDDNQKTGNKKTTWKYFEEFNLLYGNRASTTAKVTYDSVKGTLNSPQSEESSGEHGQGAPACSASTSAHQNTGKRKPSKSVTGDHELEFKNPKKAKLANVVDKLTAQGDEMIQGMRKQHEAKMNRFDKLLDLLGKRN